MITLQGRPVCGGIATGKLFLFSKEESIVSRYCVEDTEKELTRFDEARRKAVGELEKLYLDALKNIGEQEAMIFSTHQIMLEDVDYDDTVKRFIRSEHLNAEAAVNNTCDELVKIFEEMGDDYICERGEDIKDITDRIVKILTGTKMAKVYTESPVIVAAKMLSPSETVQLDKNKILAIATEKGSFNSHMAILARTMQIPAVTEIPYLMREEYSGKNSLIDGYSGRIYIEPDRKTIDKILGHN